MTSAKRTIFRVIRLVLIIELAYVVVINFALQLSLTQDLVNSIRPEKFQVSWESARSWYPFRVYVRSIKVNGQSRSQQWELHASEATGSISLLPLVLKRVSVSGVRAENIDYRQRPRLKEDRDYSNKLAHFPPITGRELIAADTSPRKKKRPWKVSLRNVQAHGKHEVWIYNLKASGSGSATVDLSIETRGGPLSLDARDINLQLDPALISGATLYSSGALEGQLSFSPFVPRENRGLRMLPHLTLDADLDLDVGSLGFLNLFTANLGDMVIRGAGHVRGHLALSEGYIRAGTNIVARAEDLSVNIDEIEIVGQGVVAIHTPEREDVPLGLDISYESLAITRLGGGEPFLVGDDLQLEYRGSNFIAPDPDMDFKEFLNDERARERRKNNTLKVLIDDASLLDMSLFNQYLPPDIPFKFTGGTADLDADIFFGVEDMSGTITLDSKDLRMQADAQALEGDLAADVIIAGGVPRDFQVDLSGSTITLDKVTVEGERDNFDGDYWSAVLDLKKIEGVFLSPLKLSAHADIKVSDTRPLVALFDNRGNPPGWLSKLMTLKDLEGEARLAISEGRVAISQAYVISDKAEVAAKALFSAKSRHSAVYVRYKKLDFLLTTENDERDLDIINVRKKFDQYEIPHGN